MEMAGPESGSEALENKKSHAEVQKIRNICILAHVDHGKTTLADSLIASNGIISQRMAGKLRYMDSREDEQLRGITMKSSAICLHHRSDGDVFTINLIDSPGHIDFSSEVSTAVRLCDGAIILVDAVEGVCAQTQAVLRQAWLENIKAILVLNKIDRLIVELKMSPLEAYLHLQRLLEQVNAITAGLFAADALSDVDRLNLSKKELVAGVTGHCNGCDTAPGLSSHSTDDLPDMDDSSIYFSPDQGNVVFASALDGWGFGVGHFARMYAAKLGLNESTLAKTLWGDYYLHSKPLRISSGAHNSGKKPLFVQLILENVWSLYGAVMVKRDKEKTAKMAAALGVKLLPRDMQHGDAKVTLQAIFSQWLPISRAVLDAVITRLPSPLEVPDSRIEKLMCGPARAFDALPQETRALKHAFTKCSSEPGSPTIILISKMFAVERKHLPKSKMRLLSAKETMARHEDVRQRYLLKARTSDPDDVVPRDGPPSHAAAIVTASSDGEAAAPASCLSHQDSSPPGLLAEKYEGEAVTQDNADPDAPVFLAFARVFSGIVQPGQRLYVLGPKHDPAKVLAKLAAGGEVNPANSLKDLSIDSHATIATVGGLYTFMGRELLPLEVGRAGSVLGIAGLEGHVLRSATLCDSLACPPFSDTFIDSTPILRVALEPKVAADMAKLVEGMALLNQADPCVEVSVQDTGEHVISVAGEVHLQRCVDDLRERYAKVDVRVSEPIVPFRETVIAPPQVDMVNEAIVNSSKKKKEAASSLIEVKTSDGICSLLIEALPLPSEAVALLEGNAATLRLLRGGGEALQGMDAAGRLEVANLRSKLASALLTMLRPKLPHRGGKDDEAVGSPHAVELVDRIWSFGPRHCGPNVLLNFVPDYERAVGVWPVAAGGGLTVPRQLPSAMDRARQPLDSMVVSGFQLATASGPMCEEPMMGVAFVVSSWTLLADSDDQASSEADRTFGNRDVREGDLGSALLARDSSMSPEERDSWSSSSSALGPLSGQLISAVKDGCRRAFQAQPQRLMVAMYSCSIQATADVLGKTYGALGKRSGRVVGEEMKEGTAMFEVTAALPVAESFGFCDEFRKRTSGLASPQLKFSHWEVLDIDPYWEPCTEEEIALYGSKYDSENRAKKYVHQVRKRKGLKVEEQIVQFAEKQRTLTRNK